MGNKWNYLPFTEAVEVNPSVPLKRGKIYPFVDMKAVESSRRGASESESREFKSGGARFMPFDTLMARITPCLENGKIARYIPSEGVGGPAFGSTEFIVIRGREGVTDNDYAYYLTKWEEFRQFAISQMTGSSGRQRVPADSLAKFLAPAPESLSEQRAIAHILGSLDDKIELNRQMAQTLESIARAIFKSWFVDFDPVKAKMEGKQPEGMSEEVAALFPDKFVESKLGMIPEGWASGKFSDISENIRINIRKDAINPNDCYIGLEHIPRKSLFLNNWGIGADVTSNKHRFLRYDLLFGKLRPYFHKIIIAPFNGICSTDILVIRSLEPHWYSLMTLGLSQESVVDNVTNQSEGTRMPRTNWNQVGSQPIVIPSKKVAIAFDALILPMLQRVVEMAHENRHLSELRDTQLPRLISGKIRVNQPEDAAA
ncbi:restriction endonuclease subunit S [Thiolapillus sp.]|uniref:restriction endonuclease subunit S n=2 Tax=Thiolapillus sp. TaxID=2017437 RepID=UPI003AF77285